MATKPAADAQRRGLPDLPPGRLGRQLRGPDHGRAGRPRPAAVPRLPHRQPPGRSTWPTPGECTRMSFIHPFGPIGTIKTGRQCRYERSPARIPAVAPAGRRHPALAADRPARPRGHEARPRRRAAGQRRRPRPRPSSRATPQTSAPPSSEPVRRKGTPLLRAGCSRPPRGPSARSAATTVRATRRCTPSSCICASGIEAGEQISETGPMPSTSAATSSADTLPGTNTTGAPASTNACPRAIASASTCSRGRSASSRQGIGAGVEDEGRDALRLRRCAARPRRQRRPLRSSGRLRSSMLAPTTPGRSPAGRSRPGRRTRLSRSAVTGKDPWPRRSGRRQ